MSRLLQAILPFAVENVTIVKISESFSFISGLTMSLSCSQTISYKTRDKWLIQHYHLLVKMKHYTFLSILTACPITNDTVALQGDLKGFILNMYDCFA